MSDEESFVILGSSPTPSLDRDGISGSHEDKVDSSLQSNSPGGSAFSSLKNSQIKELENARESASKTPTPPSLNDTKKQEDEAPMTSKAVTDAITAAADTMERSADSILWSRPPVATKEDDFLPLSLEDCAVPSPLTQSPKTSLQSKTDDTPMNRSINQIADKENIEPSNKSLQNMTKSQNAQGGPTTSSSSKNNSLASSFIMGEVDAHVLKSSVFSQFPSISMHACAEDVVKLQNMVTEYMQLKNTLEKVNETMKLFYTNSLQWKEKMNYMESHYKEQLSDCQKQIEALRAENSDLKKGIEEQIEHTKAVDLARQNDREEMIRTISEKTSLIENMRSQIVKLEQLHTASLEFLPKKLQDKTEKNFDDIYIPRDQHEKAIKELNRKLSELLASNLDLKDIENQYIAEIDCLKVNLTAAQEMFRKCTAEIAELKASDADKQKRIDELQSSNHALMATSTEQTERIILLEQQNEVHRRDFEMERESRQLAMGEKQQILQDLKVLQKRNQELIEEHQKLAENYDRRMSSANSATSSPLVAAAAAAHSFINNSQRPIRDLTPPSPSSQSVKPPERFPFRCPICHEHYKSLILLEAHVNQCLDKN